MNNKKLIPIFMFVAGFTGLHAQNMHSDLLASGGNTTGIGGSSSYSIGSVAYTTYSGTTGSVSQGVQQTYTISVVTGVENSKTTNHVFSVYPVPTSDYLILKINHESVLTKYSASLCDINGIAIRKQPITDIETQIEMQNLAPATYFLKIIVKTQGIVSQQEVKTFKIIKK